MKKKRRKNKSSFNLPLLIFLSLGMATAARQRHDPDMMQMADMIRSPNAVEAFCEHHGLTPSPSPQAGTLEMARMKGGRPTQNVVWRQCGGQPPFNPDKPNCTGLVTTHMRQLKNGPRPYFR